MGNLTNPEAYLLRGLVFCSSCGGSLSCTNKKHKHGTPYYVCGNRVQRGCVHCPTITAARLNQEVWDTILLVAQNPDWIRQQLGTKNDGDEGVALLLAERRESLKALVAKERRVLSIIETEELDDPSALVGRLNEIAAAKRIVERETTELEAQQALAEQESRGLAGLERRLAAEYQRIGELAFDEQRALLRDLGVNRVTVYPQGAVPRWTMEWSFDLSAWDELDDADVPVVCTRESSFAVNTPT